MRGNRDPQLLEWQSIEIATKAEKIISEITFLFLRALQTRCDMPRTQTISIACILSHFQSRIKKDAHRSIHNIRKTEN